MLDPETGMHRGHVGGGGGRPGTAVRDLVREVRLVDEAAAWGARDAGWGDGMEKQVAEEVTLLLDRTHEMNDAAQSKVLV